MNDERRVDPLHGITLKEMVEHLVERYAWDGLGSRIDIRCFTHEPSVGSSLKFLRRRRGHAPRWSRGTSTR